MSNILVGVSALFGGLGIASVLFFLMAVVGLANAAGAALAATGAVAAGWLFWRRPIALPEPSPRYRWHWALAGAFALVMLLVLSMAWADMEASPHGDWDAWSIWNVRARMVAGGEWRNAVSPEFRNHPDYPMLAPSLIAAVWAVAGGFPTAVPRFVALLFLAGPPVVLALGTGLLRGRGAGWLAGLLLAASAGYVTEAAAQYSDLPISLYMLLAVVWLALGRPLEAGIFASLAAWTKNEGIAFCAVLLAVALIRDRRATALVGAAPVLAFVTLFKLGLAAPTAASVSADPRLVADAARHASVLGAFARGFAGMGLGWLHPGLFAVLLGAALRFRTHAAARTVAMVAAGIVTIDYLVYVVTRQDLAWLLSTSSNRVIAQAWPVLLFTVFLYVRPVDEVDPELTREPAPAAGKRHLGRGKR